MILAVAEERNGRVNRVTWETIAAAQSLGMPVDVLVLGASTGAAASELAQAAVGAVHVVSHPGLEPYTPDGYVQALEQAISVLRPTYIFLSHTYRTRDFAPKLAARLDRALLTDCIGIKRPAIAAGKERASFLRPMFQGKLVAEVVPEGETPYFISVQIGAFRPDAAARGGTPAPITPLAVDVDPAKIRQRMEPPFQGAREAVDLSQAERIVAVGRGIKEQQHLALAQRLAAALGAEVAASRPICDAGWLPMDRQIGSSGQTVAPKLYVALGISGAIQHSVGMKGARTIVAINKDPDAPIFEIADYGIAADLFEVVPALIAELEKPTS